MHNIANRIKALRTAKGLTQDALAQQLHVTRQAVSNWETGRTQPDIETILRLAQVLNVPPEELIYDKKGTSASPKQNGLLPKENTGAQLQSLSNVVMVVGVIVSLVAGLLSGILAFVIIPLGLLTTYAFSMLLYGTGRSLELSEKTAAAVLQQEEPEEAEIPVLQEPWTCFSCGFENGCRVAYCQSCGTSKAWSQAKQEASEAPGPESNGL